MKRYKIATILSIIICFSTISQAQTYEEIVKQMQGDFDKYKDQNQKVFDKFVEENDQQFAEHLKKSWEQYNLQKEMKQPVDPKPDNNPKIDPKDVKKDKNKVDIIPVVVDTINKKNEDNDADNNSVRPIIHKDEPLDFETITDNISFYGTSLSYKYDKNFVTKVNSNIDEQYFAEYWMRMSKTNHYTFIDEMLKYKSDLNLNDYGYYLLLKKVSEKITNQDFNSSRLLTWFMLSKSRYRVRIGYAQNKAMLLIPVIQTVYGKKYYEFDNLNYYLMDDFAEQLYTYKQDYPDAKIVMDLSLLSPLSLGTNVASRNVSFEYEAKKYNLQLKYNVDLIPFYNDYPQAEIKLFFDAAISPVTKESLIENLKPILQSKSELDACNMLIALVQTGFAYKTDQQQFNKEKFFFPEEVLHYPYSDCEDRSVIFAYLVRKLLGLKVLGLAYPGHMATAVCFKQDAGLDYFLFKNQKFVVADPTYINAPVGMCMPKFIGVKANIIELENLENNGQIASGMWNTANTAGIMHGANNEDIAIDEYGNSYIVGNFQNSVKIGSFTLTAPNSNVYATAIVKFDKTGNVVWAKSTSSTEQNNGLFISVDITGNVFVAGTYSNSIKLDEQSLTSKSIKSAYLVKMDTNGKIAWMASPKIENVSLDKDYILVTKLDRLGNEQNSILFDNTETFTNFGITFDTPGNVYLTMNFTTQDAFASMDRSFNSNAGFDFGQDWKTKNDKLLKDNYVSPIAGLFAFVNTLRTPGFSVTGVTVQKTLDTYNKGIKTSSPLVFKSIGNIESMKNSGGIITITTKNGMNVEFASIVIKNNAKAKVTSYSGGNAQIEILSGISFGKNVLSFPLNNVKLVKSSGVLIFDYDTDHLQKQMNLQKDILNK